MKDLRGTKEKLGNMIKETIENSDEATGGCDNHYFYIKQFPEGKLLVYAERKTGEKSAYVICADWLESPNYFKEAAQWLHITSA